MTQEPYVMDEPRRNRVLQAVLEHCKFRDWMLLAVHVRSNHVHIVLDVPVAPEKAMNELKAYASRKLNQMGIDNPDRRRWSRHGSTRYLWTREEREAAINYVITGQGQKMAAFVSERPW